MKIVSNTVKELYLPYSHEHLLEELILKLLKIHPGIPVNVERLGAGFMVTVVIERDVVDLGFKPVKPRFDVRDGLNEAGKHYYNPERRPW